MMKNLLWLSICFVLGTRAQNTDDMSRQLLRDISDSISINNLEKNSRVKFYLRHEENFEDMNKLEFTKHPEDILLTGELPVLVQCEAKNSVQMQIECSNKIRSDAHRNISLINNVRYEHLSLMVYRKDLESTSSNLAHMRLICRCIAYSKFNEKLFSNKAIIKPAFLDEEFRSEPMDEVAYEGDTVEIRCDTPAGEPIPSVYWLKDGQEINTRSDSARIKLSNDNSLLILMSKMTDSGDYVCVATNLVDKRISKPARLTILDPTQRYQWSEWSDWSECSGPCGFGNQQRARSCQTSNIYGLTQNVSVSLCGNQAWIQSRKCKVKSCEPKWSEWSSWSKCGNDCKQVKRRYCENESANADYPETFSLDMPNTKFCIGEKTMIRNCCKSDQIDKINPDDLNYFNQTFLKLSIGLTASILLACLLILVIVLCFILKRTKKSTKTNSDLNLYYTCEKQYPLEDDCSIYKFSKGSMSGSGSYFCRNNNNTSIKLPIHSDSVAPIIYSNSNRVQNFENQLLLGNLSQHYQIMANSSYKKTNNSASLSSTASKNVTSTTITSSPSVCNDYVHLTNELDDSNYAFNEFVLNKNKNTFKNAKESAYMNISDQTLERLAHLQQIKNRQDEELAYDIAEPSLGLKSFLPIGLDLSDACIGTVNSEGARLTLDCGISLVIPEGALPENQNFLMYLGVCRNESHKPRLEEKSTFLSEIIQIGPANLNLKKPVVLIMDHSANNFDSWNIKTCYSASPDDSVPEWSEHVDSFLNSVDSSFVLMIEKFGKFCILGEPTREASKQYRLMVFYSTSITSSEICLRIYCIDGLLVALQEVLRDEKKIGGHLLESSEAFNLSYSNESMTIRIEDLNTEFFNCKYSVNFQDIPLRHIWTGRNHLLHCSFILEKLNHPRHNSKQMLDCRVIAAVNREALCSVPVSYNINNSDYDNLREVGFNWNARENVDIMNPKNLIKTYLKIDKNLKKQISLVLDKSFKLDKNWTGLANKLNINRNLNYFAVRSSPTEMLLLYFEAISGLKCRDLIQLNNALINSPNNSSPQEFLFREIFLKYIM